MIPRHIEKRIHDSFRYSKRMHTRIGGFRQDNRRAAMGRLELFQKREDKPWQNCISAYQNLQAPDQERAIMYVAFRLSSRGVLWRRALSSGRCPEMNGK